jgi:hypothetical protein
MTISMHVMSVGSFVPMLESLSAILDKAEAHAKATKLDLVDTRLAPDMLTLAKQVQLACDNACNGAARLSAQMPPMFEDDETTIADLKARIAKSIAYLRGLPATSFDGAEDRDCTFPMPNNPKLAFGMNGLDFLRAWALPHFYFHVVTAYDILRHNGVAIGKPDYLSQVGAFVRPRAD